MNIDRYKDKYIIKIDGTIISTYTNKPIKHHIGYGGYPAVVLTDVKGKQHHEYIHKLLAEKFIPNPNNYKIINHKDENPLNYNIDNLEWCTSYYNNTYNNRHKKAGLKLKGRIAPNKGVPMSEEQKIKLSKINKGHKFRGNQYIKVLP